MTSILCQDAIKVTKCFLCGLAVSHMKRGLSRHEPLQVRAGFGKAAEFS